MVQVLQAYLSLILVLTTPSLCQLVPQPLVTMLQAPKLLTGSRSAILNRARRLPTAGQMWAILLALPS